MRHIIYGANRVAKDFLYIFEQLEIDCVVDPKYRGGFFCGYRVMDEKTLLEKRDDMQVIICDFDKADREARLKEIGLAYGKDYLYEEDFFARLDAFCVPKDRKTAIWGTGKIAGEFCGSCPEICPELYIDSYPKGAYFRGKNVARPQEIESWKEWFIVICVEKDRDIRKKLDELGLKEDEDYAGYQAVMGLPSRMLRQTIFDKAYYGLECHTMLNHLEILRGGDSRCCCTTFVRQNLDNIMKHSIDAVWKSALHKIMCLSTQNHTYSFCDKSMCPLFVGKKEEKGEEGRILGEDYKKMADYPETLALGYDATCNLCCVTCRKEPYMAQAEEQEILSGISARIQKHYLPHCKFLILAGDGEVFFSPAYREIYRDEKCNPPYIRLLSNGMLFSRKNWEKFAEGKTGQIMLTVSVDAATGTTYEKIRRNSRFDILQENMAFASALRREGKLRYFRLNFVVQRKNYTEMPLFVQWGKELGADEIFFTKILNWGTYTDEEFDRISMMEKDGVTPKQELREIMQLPIMHSDIVDMGTIQYGHKTDRADIVENYYMWELEKRGGKIFG